MNQAFASFPALALALSLPLAVATAHAQAPAGQATKPAAAQPAAKSAAPAKAATQPKPRLARSAAKAVEEVTPIDDDPNVTLTEDDLAIAKKVYIGHIPCELGTSVQITPSRREGFFIVQTKGHRFSMHPVASRTGAIRLEDGRRGALWLQLGNKSMLMSQKIGQRLADECTSPEQVTFADQMKKEPPRSLLDPETPAGPPSTRN